MRGNRGRRWGRSDRQGPESGALGCSQGLRLVGGTMDEFSVREWRRMALSRAGRGWSTVMAPRRHFLQQKIGCHGCRTTGPGLA